MDRIIKMWLNVLLFIFVIMVLFFVISYNPENNTSLLILSSVLITSVSIRYLFFYESEKFYKLGLPSILFDAILIYFISIMDKYGIAEIFYLVLISDSIIFHHTLYSISITIVGFFTYLTIVYISKGPYITKNFIPYVLTSFLSISFIIVVMSIVKYVINQHHKLKETMEKLEIAHEQLKETTIQLKQMAIIDERNRIASDVHDTIGHTLTTVLVEMEAGIRIFKKNPDEALNKFVLAQQQVRNGLDNIMKSIKAINKDNDSTGEFVSSMEKLIKETVIHTGILIKYTISDIPKINKDIQTTLYRALKEGLTNGIRHGKCREAVFSLREEDSKIMFTLKDYGNGCKNIIPGYGLKTMKERVENLGGSLDITLHTGNGCVLNIELPY